MYSDLHWFNEKNLVSKTYRICGPEMLRGFQFEYNKDNLLIKKIEIDTADSPKQVHLYSYDKNDLLLEEKVLLPSGELQYRITYVYNDQGDETKRTVHDSNGNITQQIITKYSYDKEMNWIRKEEFWDGIPSYTTYREITYYE